MGPPRLDDPDLMLAQVFETWPAVIPVFLRRRMLCVGCPITPFHTVIDACEEYGLDEAEFRAELARAVSGDVVTKFPRARAGAGP